MLRRLTATGRHDPSFGAGGTVVPDLGRPASGVAGLVVLPDGKVLLRASADRTLFEGEQALVARLHPDGALDTTFGTGGVTTLDLRAQSLHATALLPQADGGVLLGLTQDVEQPATADFAVARLHPYGSPDDSWGPGGVRLVDLGGDDRLRTLIAAPGGGLLAMGSTFDGRTVTAAVARLTANGELDRRFGRQGVLRVSTGTGETTATSAVLADGGLVIGGFDVSGSYWHGYVARITLAGRLDRRFGERGVLVFDEPGAVESAGVVGPAADGDLLVARAVGDGPFLARLLEIDPTTGALDPSFGSGGTLDVGEIAGTGVLVDGSGFLLSGTRWTEGGFTTQQVVERYR